METSNQVSVSRPQISSELPIVGTGKRDIIQTHRVHAAFNVALSSMSQGNARPLHTFLTNFPEFERELPRIGLRSVEDVKTIMKTNEMILEETHFELEPDIMETSIELVKAATKLLFVGTLFLLVSPLIGAVWCLKRV